MASRKRLGYLALLFIFAVPIIACRSSVRTVDPSEDVEYSAAYGYRDLQRLSAEMAGRILQTSIAKEEKPPVMLIFGIDNRTDEHIDTKALADAIRNDLLKSGKFQFINEAVRQKLQAEMAYQSQGYITPETRVKFGKQIGAKYILSGSLVSITQKQLKQVRVKKKSLKYYRLTLEITDIDTNLIVWTDEQEIVREQSKPFIGW